LEQNGLNINFLSGSYSLIVYFDLRVIPHTQQFASIPYASLRRYTART